MNVFGDNDSSAIRRKSELQLLREKKIKEQDALMSQMMKDPEYIEISKSAEGIRPQLKVPKNINPETDPSFKFRGHIDVPVEKRRSNRLQKLPPFVYSTDEEDISKRKRSPKKDYYDLEVVIHQPKKSRPSHQTDRRIVSVEQITDAMIAKIAKKGTNKNYSVEGTCCHQCRQKTLDQKTYCRSSFCIGLRGQFCGVCLQNRYGEDAAVALKDPFWSCPVCRDICNCSFCRQKVGKRPTGILAPIAQKKGHKSVKDFLESLKGEGDYDHQDSLFKNLNDPECLLGYSKDLKFAYMGGMKKIEIEVNLPLSKLKEYIREAEHKIKSMSGLHKDPKCLLGFFYGTNIALLGDGSHCDMSSSFTKYNSKILNMDILAPTRGTESELTFQAKIAKITRKGIVQTGQTGFDEGTVCHLCKEKTLDQKTYCSSSSCVGKGEHFCGVCLINRYKEDIDVALKDPLWKCPLCRRTCNCLFCYQKTVSPAVISVAQQITHKSANYQQSLEEKEGNTQCDSFRTNLNDHRFVLEYSRDFKQLPNLGEYTREEESMTDLNNDDDAGLMGFFKGTNVALLDDGSICNMSGTATKYNISKKKLNADVAIKTEPPDFGVSIKKKKLDTVELNPSNTGLLDRNITHHLDNTKCQNQDSESVARFNKSIQEIDDNDRDAQGLLKGVVVKIERLDWEELNTSNTISGENTFLDREVIQNLGVVIKREKLDDNELNLLNTVDENEKVKPQSISVESNILDREGTPHLVIVMKKEKLDQEELSLSNTVDVKEKTKSQVISAENNLLNREGTPHLGVVIKREKLDCDELSLSNTVDEKEQTKPQRINTENNIFDREGTPHLGVVVKKERLDWEELNTSETISGENTFLDREVIQNLGVIKKREKLVCDELSLLNTVDKNEKVKSQSISAENNILNRKGTPYIRDLVKKEKLGYDELSPSNTQGISGENILDLEGTPHLGVLIKKEPPEFDEINTSNTIQENNIVDRELTQHLDNMSIQNEDCENVAGSNEYIQDMENGDDNRDTHGFLEDGNQDFENVSRSSECVQNIENADNNDDEEGYLRGMSEYILEDGTCIVFNVIELLN